jgi:hypothetical protein
MLKVVWLDEYFKCEFDDLQYNQPKNIVASFAAAPGYQV